MNLSYLFDLDKFHDHAGHVHPEEVCCTIDGRDYGTVSRFINHSCDPNLATYAVASDRRDGKIYNLALFTGEDVEPYEELTFSYTSSETATTDKGSWPCLCGSDNCVGTLWA